MENIITSTSNKIIKTVIKLFDDKKYRDKTNLFVCQSKKVINTLISLDFKLDKIIISQNSKYYDKFKKFPKAFIVNNNIYEYISHQKNGDGLIAIFNQKIKSESLDFNSDVIIFDNIQNPNNLGAILRICAAFNINNLILTNNSVNQYNYKVIQTSMGYGLDVNIVISKNLVNSIKNLQNNNYIVYATGFSKKAINLNTLTNKPKPKKIAILFGNEGLGLKQKQMELCNQTISILINNKVDSLNLSTAVAIIVYFIKTWK